MNEQDINQEAAEQICNTARLNGQQFKWGDWVALLDGKVVAVAPDIDAALTALRSIDGNPWRGMILEVAPPAVDVIL